MIVHQGAAKGAWHEKTKENRDWLVFDFFCSVMLEETCMGTQ